MSKKKTKNIAPSSMKNIITLNDSFERFLDYMPNPDIIFDKENFPEEIYREMLNDYQVSAKADQLFDTVLGKEWKIIPSDNDSRSIMIADFVKNTLNEKLNLKYDLKELLTAILYGYAVTEVIWEEKNGYMLPEKLLGRKQERFSFKHDGTLLYRDMGQLIPLKQDYKFIIHRNGMINENPYGQSLLSRCYWPYMMKKQGYLFWMQALDRFGIPTILALFDYDSDDDNKVQSKANMIAQSLNSIKSNSSAAFGNITDVKTVSANGKGEDFKLLVDLCDQSISKALTGEVLTSDIGNTGSYALSSTHADTLTKKGMKFANNLANTLNRTLIKWITELNFGLETKPPVFVFENSTLPNWDVIKDAIDRGIPISKKALYHSYSIPEPEDNEDAFIKEQPDNNIGFSDFFFQTKKQRQKIQLKQNLK